MSEYQNPLHRCLDCGAPASGPETFCEECQEAFAAEEAEKAYKWEGWEPLPCDWSGCEETAFHQLGLKSHPGECTSYYCKEHTHVALQGRSWYLIQ